MAVWSELPYHLLGLVFHHLSYPDLVRSHTICKSWLLASKSADMPIKTRSPMLLLGGDEIDDESEFRTLFSLEEKKSYRLHLPQIRGCRILASADGWLVAIDDAAELHLFNPFTLVKHALPSITTLPVIKSVRRDSITGRITGYMYDPGEDQRFCFCDLEDMRAGFYSKAIIFHQPSSSGIVVFIICSDESYLAFARPGEECWTGVEKIPPYSCFKDVISHKGHYYGLTFNGSVIAFDIFSSSSLPKMIYEGPRYVKESFLRRYLAESSDGDSLMHIRRYGAWTLREDGGVDLHGPLNTGRFTVFLLGMIKNEMIKVERLEQGTALLLGGNRSMVLRTQDLPELRENCIYFTDGDIPHHRRWRVAFFDMTTGSVEPLCPSESILNVPTRSPPVWLTPHCQY